MTSECEGLRPDAAAPEGDARRPLVTSEREGLRPDAAAPECLARRPLVTSEREGLRPDAAPPERLARHAEHGVDVRQRAVAEQREAGQAEQRVERVAHIARPVGDAALLAILAGQDKPERRARGVTEEVHGVTAQGTC